MSTIFSDKRSASRTKGKSNGVWVVGSSRVDRQGGAPRGGKEPSVLEDYPIFHPMSGNVESFVGRRY